MKIDFMELYSYGRFLNKKIQFKNGLNIIYGDNGRGKTTVATALKTFLYKKYNSEYAYKKRYIPINSKDAAYDIHFSLDDGSQYETTVTLGQTASKTIVKTFNNAGMEAAIGDKEVGEYFFGVSEEMFDSVCLIKSPSDFNKISSNNSTVGENIFKNRLQTGDYPSISDALSKIDKEIKEYSRKTSTGKIFPIECELEEINEQIRKADLIAEESDKLLNEIKSIDLGITDIEKENEILNAETEKHKTFDLYKKYTAYVTQKHKEDLLTQELEDIKINNDLLNPSEKNTVEKLQNTINGTMKLDFEKIMFAGLFALSLILSALSLYKLYFIIPAAVSLASCAFVLFKYAKKKKKYLTAVNDAEKSLRSILDKYGFKSADEYYSAFESNSSEMMKYENINKELTLIKEMMPDIPERSFSYTPEQPTSDYNDISGRLQENRLTVNYLKEKRAVLSERRKNLFNNIPEYNELINRKKESEIKLENLKYEYEVTLAAYNAMEKTQYSYKESYLPSFRKETEKILKDTGIIEFDRLYLNEDLAPEIKEKNENITKTFEYLSSGISDCIYFAERLAAYNLAFDRKEKPVLILDDPFIRMDDEKTKKWIEYLSEKHNGQIVFFTSSKRIFQFILEKDTIYGL